MKRPPRPGTGLPLRLAATAFGIGEAAPFAPATFASLAMLPLLFGFLVLPGWAQAALAAATVAIAVPVGTRAERAYGHDARAIVIDEVAGMLVTFLFVPALETPAERWILLLAGFALFRVFDVVKPFPAGRAQDLPAGWGVVADDAIAGVYANVVLRVGLAVAT